MPIKQCRYCLAEVETQAKLRHPVCVSCQRRRQIEAVREWRDGPRNRERKVMVSRKIKETMYYPSKVDDSIILAIEP